MEESELLQWLVDTLVLYGPAVLFVSCLMETAVFAGLVLPVGSLIAFSAMLSSRGVFDPWVIVAVALSGALAGDQIGFGIGRWFRGIARPRKGEMARLWRITLTRTESLINSRGALGIMAARAVPFVRTVMPWFAGRSDLGWGRFLFFDILGVVLWGTIYVGGGFLAGKGWSQMAALLGEAAGAAVVIVAIIATFMALRGWVSSRFRRATGGDSIPGEDAAS